jgi:sensor domain CHASE-containing protein
LVGNPESKGPKHKWEDNNKMDLEEILWDCVDWINVAEDKDKWQAVVNRVMILQVP